jgi:hypothetical protein
LDSASYITTRLTLFGLPHIRRTHTIPQLALPRPAISPLAAAVARLPARPTFTCVLLAIAAFLANRHSSPLLDHQLREQVELLRNHDADPSTNPDSFDEGRASADRSPSLASNGYDGPSAARSSSTPHESHGPESQIDPDLRGPGEEPVDTMMPLAPPSGDSPGHTAAAMPGAPLAPAPPMNPPASEELDGRKAKRELSSSKRAAQNRAAQRAFRQRKECYIKKLEQQVRDLAGLERQFKVMQSENYALREYVIHLQARVMDTHGELPPPPPNVNLSLPDTGSSQGPPPAAPAPVASQPPASPNSGVGTPLEAVAQAVAGLAAQEQLAERQQRYPSPPAGKAEPTDEDTRTADEINQHLQPMEAVTSTSAA